MAGERHVFQILVSTCQPRIPGYVCDCLWRGTKRTRNSDVSSSNCVLVRPGSRRSFKRCHQSRLDQDLVVFFVTLDLSWRGSGLKTSEVNGNRIGKGYFFWIRYWCKIVTTLRILIVVFFLDNFFPPFWVRCRSGFLKMRYWEVFLG